MQSPVALTMELRIQFCYNRQVQVLGITDIPILADGNVTQGLHQQSISAVKAGWLAELYWHSGKPLHNTCKHRNIQRSQDLTHYIAQRRPLAHQMHRNGIHAGRSNRHHAKPYPQAAHHRPGDHRTEGCPFFECARKKLLSSFITPLQRGGGHLFALL